MAELSPTAQAVLDAANSAYNDAATTAQGIAAALRALAAGHSENLYDQHEGKVAVVRSYILSTIADELEDANG